MEPESELMELILEQKQYIESVSHLRVCVYLTKPVIVNKLLSQGLIYPTSSPWCVVSYGSIRPIQLLPV